MAKGIIVVDVPRCCGNCRMGFDNECTDKFECFLNPEKELIDPDHTKPDWCPIRPMPEKKDVTPLSKESYVAGWNDCIDKILEGE